MSRPLAVEQVPDEGAVKALTTRAADIKSGLSKLTHPVVVEFSGSPKSGKTTNIDIIEHFFKRSRFKVWAPTEGASKRTPHHLRHDLVAFNAWSLNYAISELLLAYHNIDKPDLVILDRGPFDSLAWMGLLRDEGNLSEREYEIIREFALHPYWVKLIDRVYLFTCSPEVSLARENDCKLTEGHGIAMNPVRLGNIREKYKILAEVHTDYPIVTVSTTDTKGPAAPKASVFAIVSDLLDCFSEKLRCCHE